jgi:hypothetical protein
MHEEERLRREALADRMKAPRLSRHTSKLSSRASLSMNPEVFVQKLSTGAGASDPAGAFPNRSSLASGERGTFASRCADLSTAPAQTNVPYVVVRAITTNRKFCSTRTARLIVGTEDPMTAAEERWQALLEKGPAAATSPSPGRDAAWTAAWHHPSIRADLLRGAQGAHNGRCGTSTGNPRLH